MTDHSQLDALRTRRKDVLAQVDRLMKTLQARYTHTEDRKTIFVELFVKNSQTGREFVVATDSACAMFVELQDIPRGELAAFRKAEEKARTFFSNMAIFWDTARDSAHIGQTHFFGDAYFTMNLETPKDPYVN